MIAVRLLAASALYLCVSVTIVSVTIAAEPYTNIEQAFTREELHETGLDGLTPQQLARLNQLLREKQESAYAGTASGSTADPPAREGQRLAAMDLEPRIIKSRLRGRIDSWAPGSEFRLENGQTWKVLKGEAKLRQAMDAPEILVVPGVAGRWFLQVHEDYPKARVYRID